MEAKESRRWLVMLDFVSCCCAQACIFFFFLGGCLPSFLPGAEAENGDGAHGGVSGVGNRGIGPDSWVDSYNVGRQERREKY